MRTNRAIVGRKYRVQLEMIKNRLIWFEKEDNLEYWSAIQKAIVCLEHKAPAHALASLCACHPSPDRITHITQKLACLIDNIPMTME